MNVLVEVLFVLSTALLIPVVLSLLLFVLWLLLEMGGFLREGLERRRTRDARRAWIDERFVQSENEAAQLPETLARSGLLGLFISRSQKQTGEAETIKLMADLEVEAGRRLARMSLGIRLGPMLGLMGTLIPMGPALIGLSQGDVGDLARQLVVAFSTTVLGLLVGGVSYTMWLARRQWYAQDLTDIAYAVRRLTTLGPETPHAHLG